MLDGQCLLAYQKTEPVTRAGLKLYNLGAGAIAEDLTPAYSLVDIARRSVDALGLRLAAVDIVQVAGEQLVLEVNDGFMMEYYLRQSDANYRRTVELYEQVLLAAL